MKIVNFIISIPMIVLLGIFYLLGIKSTDDTSEMLVGRHK